MDYKKSIGCILYILAREYCKNKKIPFKYNIEDFTGTLWALATMPCANS